MSYPRFPKIPHWNREIIITEKIDGTPGLVHIVAPGKPSPGAAVAGIVLDDGTKLFAGSRDRWIHPEDDNHGFAKWVWGNARELAKLGPGKHYGEWYGKGLGRGYGLSERRFMLFNVQRWSSKYPGARQTPPDCVEVASYLASAWPLDIFYTLPTVMAILERGSVHVPGWPRPEGVVLFHTDANQMFKICFDDDQISAKKKVTEAIQKWTNKDFTPPLGRETSDLMATVGG